MLLNLFMDVFNSFFKSAYSVMLMSAPYFLLGISISVLIKRFISTEAVVRYMGSNTWRDVFWGSFLGIPLPLCSCSVVPTSATLRKEGASVAGTSSFLISTPESGVDSIALTYGLLGPFMAITRPICAFVSAFLAGIMNLIFNENFEVEGVMKSCCPNSKKSEQSSWKEAFKYGFGNLVNDLALWFIIGIIFSAVFDILFPYDFFVEVGPTKSKLYIILFSLPLYVCASASTPIGLIFLTKGLSPGGVLIFLLVGPATNITNLSVIQKFIGTRGVVINLISIVIVALTASWIVDSYFHMDILPTETTGHHNHDMLKNFEIVCAFITSILLIKGVVVENVIPLINKEKRHQH